MSTLEDALHGLRTNAETAVTMVPGAISLSGATRLANRIKGNRTLKQLYLNSCQLTDAHVELLARAVQQSSLRTLFLGHNAIGEAGATAVLQACFACTSLQSISLYGNNLGDLGAIRLAPLLSGLQIEKLDLGNNRIGDEGALALAQNLPRSTIRDMSLAENLLTDAGGMAMANAIQGSAYIERLDLSGNRSVGRDTLGAFMEAVRTHRCIRIITLSPGTEITREDEEAVLQPALRIIHSNRVRLLVTLCSPSCVERIGKQSPLRHLTSDLIRLLCESLNLKDC